MKNQLMIKMFLFLSFINLKALEISLPFNVEESDILKRLKESRIIKDIFFEEGKDLRIIFEDDLNENFFSFRNNRKKELSLLRQEAIIVLQLLKRKQNTFDKIDKDRLEKLEAFKNFYSKIIPEREKEESLSFLDFLALYLDNKERLLEDIKNTNNRISY